MPDRFVETHIRKHPMFTQLTDAQLELVVRAFEVLRFSAGDIVVQQGKPTQGFFMMVSGEGDMVQDGQILGQVYPGDTLDRGALFRQDVEPATLMITEASVLLFLSQDRMNTILSFYPDIRNTLGTADTGETATPAQRIRPHARDAEGTGHNLQRENEEIIMIRRRHPWSFVRRGWMSVLIFIGFLAAAIATLTFSASLAATLLGLGFVMSGLLMTYFYFEWRNDSIVITDHRVIMIERVIPAFSVSINEMPLEQIQEVNTELPTGDIFARIFDYGDLELKNASDAGNLVLDMVPNPDEVQDAIFANRNQRQQLAEETRRSAIRGEIERQIGIHQDGLPYNENKMKDEGGITPNTESAFLRSFSPAPMQFTNASGDTVIRKHVTVWLGGIFAPSVVLISAFAITAMSISAQQGWLNRIGLPLAAGLFVLGILWFWWSDWDWRNDMYILGDEKITLIHKRPLWLQNEVEQIRLERVDNVLSETKGFISTLFQRGDVKVSLVGEGIDNAKAFRKVHRPHEIQAEISRRQARTRNQNENREDARQREAIREYISVYHETINDETQPDSASAEPQPPAYPARRDQSRPPRIPRLREKSAREQAAPKETSSQYSVPTQQASPPKTPKETDNAVSQQQESSTSQDRKPPRPPNLPEKPPTLPGT